MPKILPINTLIFVKLLTLFMPLAFVAFSLLSCAVDQSIVVNVEIANDFNEQVVIILDNKKKTVTAGLTVKWRVFWQGADNWDDIIHYNSKGFTTRDYPITLYTLATPEDKIFKTIALESNQTRADNSVNYNTQHYKVSEFFPPTKKY